jgi:hypothetical protein
MVVLHWAKHVQGKTLAKVLQDVRDALAEYRTNVRKNGQAVTLHYESWPNVDVVPVSKTKNSDGTVNHYDVPNMNTWRWLEARPRRHSTAINAKASTCGARFKPVITMIKQWNKAHSDLMESFHIEVLCMNIFDGPITDYSWSIFQFFDHAVKLVECPFAYDGAYADDYLDAVEDREAVIDRLEVAKDRARTAWYSTFLRNDDHEGAIAIWRQIFGEKFPAYG